MKDSISKIVAVSVVGAALAQASMAGSYQCDEAQDAAQQLYSAAIYLANCAGGGDLQDCSSEAYSVESAYSDYESARSELDDPDDCY